MIKKKILIIGITGQDGSYLAKLILNKKFIVHGTSRKKSDWAKNLKYLNISNKIRVYQTDKKFNNLNKILSNNYDYIFYIRPEFDIVDDGVRSISLDFRDEISDLFEGFITELPREHITVSGSVRERVDQVLKVIS